MCSGVVRALTAFMFSWFQMPAIGDLAWAASHLLAYEKLVLKWAHLPYQQLDSTVKEGKRPLFGHFGVRWLSAVDANDLNFECYEDIWIAPV